MSNTAPLAFLLPWYGSIMLLGLITLVTATTLPATHWTLGAQLWGACVAIFSLWALHVRMGRISPPPLSCRAVGQSTVTDLARWRG